MITGSHAIEPWSYSSQLVDVWRDHTGPQVDQAMEPVRLDSRHLATYSGPDFPGQKSRPDRKPQDEPFHGIPRHLSQRPPAQPRLRRPLSRLQETHLLSPPLRFPLCPSRRHFPLNHLGPLIPLSERLTSQLPVSRGAHEAKPESF
jgi:hypothetical protein